MGTLIERLTKILNSFDEKDSPIDEFAINSELNSLASEKLDGDEQEQFLLQAETMAFGFMEDYPDQRTGWDTYFGPMVVMPDKNGQWFESPSIHLVTTKMLVYWLERANAANNPILKKRYADLVWDFSRQVTSTQPDIQSAYLTIDNSFRIVEEKRYSEEVFAIKKLIRAISIALSISDSERTNRAITSIIALEDQIGEDTKIGLWGFSFDTLVKNKKVPLTSDQCKKIINDLEARLQRFVTNTDYSFSVYAAENAAMRLVQYYQRQNDIDNIQRVLRTYGDLVVANAEKGSAMVGLASVEKLFDIYTSHGMRKDADGLAQLLENLGKRTEEEMHTVSHEVKIPKEQFEQYFSRFLDGSLEMAFARIALEFVPDPDKIASQVRELAKEAPLTFLIPHSILDTEGRTIARIGSVENDFDGRVVYQTSQNMEFSTPFLNEAIKRTFDKYQPALETILDHLYLSPLFQPENKHIINSGLQAYRNNDHLVAAHLLIPQIENSIRRLLKLTDGSIYKPGRNGGFFLKTLDEILREDLIKNILGVDIAQYLQILLTDPRGWNLRNDICHGMAPPSIFGPGLTDRLFHVLLVLALFRSQSISDKEQTPAEAKV